jgi:NAD+ synthase
MNFIIFTGFEDTPIDDEIFDKIPNNVLSIYASNCISFGDKVIPIPYGIKRRLGHWDNSQSILVSKINTFVEPTGLVYMSHSITNSERLKVSEYFKDKSWATIQSNVDYNTFLDSIKNHKFVICPDGNAIGCECHRDWETLYMRRVPIVKDSKYLREIFKGFPVLFVNDFCDVTEKLLLENEHLYEEALNYDISKLDMSRIYKEIISKYEYVDIVEWIKDYAKPNKFSLVVGISGGIDSALVSTLCAKTGLTTYVVSMPIFQKEDQLLRARNHIKWLKSNYDNVVDLEFDLTKSFQSFSNNFNNNESFNSPLSLANSRSRLRMTTLYHIASNVNGIVVGTGNKVEDFGVGFFTKYGDGGVDISPIADLTKTEVRQMAKTLGVNDDIIVAKPTDGLWEDDRSDEDQIGATYEELEWAMEFNGDLSELSERNREVYNIYKKFNNSNKHKMIEIPVYKKNN